MKEQLRAEGISLKEATSPMEWGHQLRKMREINGASITDVAMELRLDPKLIEAIEMQNEQALPSIPYVKGYLRAYARFLGMEPEAILEAYSTGRVDHSQNNVRRVVTIKDTPATSASRQKTPRVVTWGVGGLLVVSFGLWWYELAGNGGGTVALPDVPEVATIEPGAVALALPAPAYESQPPAGEVAATVADTTQVPVPGAEAVTAVNTATPAPDVQNKATVINFPPEKASISLRFRSDAWVDITDSHNVKLIAGTAKAGQKRTVEGNPPFQVILGNSSAVSVEYNGVLFDHKQYDSKGIARFALGNDPDE
jgi:cytoskeleton protein RodZ